MKYGEHQIVSKCVTLIINQLSRWCWTICCPAVSTMLMFHWPLTLRNWTVRSTLYVHKLNFNVRILVIRIFVVCIRSCKAFSHLWTWRWAFGILRRGHVWTTNCMLLLSLSGEAHPGACLCVAGLWKHFIDPVLPERSAHGNTDTNDGHCQLGCMPDQQGTSIPWISLN